MTRVELITVRFAPRAEVRRMFVGGKVDQVKKQSQSGQANLRSKQGQVVVRKRGEVRVRLSPLA